MKLFIHAPIPPPRTWIASTDVEPPLGFTRLIGASITRNSAQKTSLNAEVVPADTRMVKTPGNSLVRVQDVSDLERVVQAFGRCDAAGRAELLKIAEVLASAAP